MSPPARTVMRPSVNLWVKIVVSLAGAAGTAGETPSPPDGVTGDFVVVVVVAAAVFCVASFCARAVAFASSTF